MKRPFAGQAILNANATVQTLHSAHDANTTVYLTKAVLSITTHANAKSTTIGDSNTTPLAVGTVNDLTAAAGVPDVVTFNFGSRGVALTKGKNLTSTGQASGTAGVVYFEGYEIRS